jgi:hypothetical protein
MFGRPWSVSLLVLLIGAAGLLVGPVEANAQPSQPWSACPANRSEDALVRTGRMNYYLRCGNAQKGVRHIVARHRADFQRMVFNTGTTWVDVADFAMEAIARDPDVAIPGDPDNPRDGGKACLSRVLYLRNAQTGQVDRIQIFRMIVVVATGEVITAYPHSEQCKKRDRPGPRVA